MFVAQLKQSLRKYRKPDAEKGEIMVEAMLVVVITVMVLFFLLLLTFLFYQQAAMNISANDIAVRVAQTYRFVDSEPVMGFVTPDDVTSVNRYRYFTSSSSETFEEEAEDKAQIYGEFRLGKTAFLEKIGDSEISLDVISDALGRRHVEVTVTATYNVGALAFLGFFVDDITDTTYELSASARAEAPDIIDYISTINAVKLISNGGLTTGDKFISCVNAVLEAINAVCDAIDAWTE